MIRMIAHPYTQKTTKTYSFAVHLSLTTCATLWQLLANLNSLESIKTCSTGKIIYCYPCATFRTGTPLQLYDPLVQLITASVGVWPLVVIGQHLPCANGKPLYRYRPVLSSPVLGGLFARQTQKQEMVCREERD